MNDSALIDEHYFRMERWPIRPGSAPGLSIPLLKVQMLFVQEGRIRIAGRNFEPFVVDRNQLAVVPAASDQWSLTTEAAAEIIRILPAEG